MAIDDGRYKSEDDGLVLPFSNGLMDGLRKQYPGLTDDQTSLISEQLQGIFEHGIMNGNHLALAAEAPDGGFDVTIYKLRDVVDDVLRLPAED